MRGDYTRFTFDPRKRFTSVLLQQGRVQLDSDWNELAAITAHLEQTETGDVIGVCGAPEAGGGFAIEPLDTADFQITSGRIYVGGLLCELLPETQPVTGFPTAQKIELPTVVLDGRPLATGDWVEVAARDKAARTFRVINVAGSTVTLHKSPSDFDSPEKDPTVRRALTYLTQPDLPDPPALIAGRTDLVYLDVWQRHVTAIEDPQIREEALLGPDTATRVQTVCQVRIAPNKADCDDIDDLRDAASGGRLSTRATPGADAENLCIVPPGGGYNALENRLYRVEIHERGDIGTATYKWSRYNGAVAYSVARFDPAVTDRIWLDGLGDDEVLRLSLGDWVEVMDDDTELAGEVGKLVRVDGIDEAERSIQISSAIPGGTFAVGRHARVRRWDEDEGTSGDVDTVTGWIGLENGVEIRFSGEDFNSGDYWSFAARTNTGRVDVLTERPPANVEHRLCPLAILEWSSGGSPTAKRLHDCRPPFVSLVDLLSQRVLRYVAGDGQEGRPGAVLPEELVVGVEDGLGRPVAGYDVVFTATKGGKLEPGPMSPLPAKTDSKGIAKCRWQLGPDPDEPGEVRAELAATPSPQNKSLPVIFHATAYYLSLRYLSGDGQHGRPNAVLPAQLVVGVEDAGGRPVSGAKVSFAAQHGFVGEVGTNPASASFDRTTGADGVARADWKLGADPDELQRVVAKLTAPGQDKAPLEVTFAATAQYLSLRYLGGDAQSGRAGEVLPAPLVVGVEDSDGRPVTGVSVLFEVLESDGFVGDTGADPTQNTFTVATDAQGRARAAWKLQDDPDGEQLVRASLQGVGSAGAQDSALRVDFRAKAQYLSLRYITGDGREGRPGEVLTDPPLAVGVEDSDGRPVEAVPVVFVPSPGAQVRPNGGPFSTNPITIVTGQSGSAACEMKLGDDDGVYTVVAGLDTSLKQDESLPILFRERAETAVEHDRLPTVERISWTNDSPLMVDQLNAGLTVRFSEPMSPVSLRHRDLFVVSVELAEPDAQGMHVGLHSHIISGNVTPTAGNREWTFVPSPPVQPGAVTRWRGQLPQVGMEDPRVRIALKSHGIFSERGLYLNGDVLWAEGAAGVLSKPARVGDPHEGGDFESWAYLQLRPTPTFFTIRPTIEPTLHPTFHTFTVPPGFTRPPVFVATPRPIFQPSFVPGPVPRFEGVLPVAGAEIANADGEALAHVGSATVRPTVAASDAPAALELEIGATLPNDQAIAFVESLRLVDADGRVASGAPEFLPGNRIRIPVEGELSRGDYMLVPHGNVESDPTFAFHVS